MTYRKLLYSSIAYLYIPLFIFILSWVKIWIAIPVAICSVYAIWRGFRKQSSDRTERISVSKWEVLIYFFVAIGICVVCGGGDIFPQDYDWSKHHAILYDLVNYEWPVVYQGDVMLTYYLGQYMVPALIGKLFGQSEVIALWSMVIWNAIGLLIVYLWVCKLVNANTIWKRIGVFVILLFFGGASNIGNKLYQKMGHDVELLSFKWIAYRDFRVHFASNFDTLRGAFQHLIIPWISCCLFLDDWKRTERYVALALPLFFGATFGFVYFSLILFACFVICVIAEKGEEIWRRTFSVSNILLIPLALVIICYLGGNVFGDKPDSVGFEIVDYSIRPEFYAIFVAVEFLGYAIFCFWNNRKNPVYYVVLCELLVIPFLSMGMFNDLCSRGSIPARFVLMVLAIRQLCTSGWRSIQNWLLSITFIICASNTWNEGKELYRLTKAYGFCNKQVIMDEFHTLDGMAGKVDERPDEAYNYYTLEYSESIFHLIARK